MKINYALFDPCGNITALVDTKVERKDRINVANKIMECEPTCEQVGFVVNNSDTVEIEMAGMEFCGNASRCAALYKSKSKVKCSGFADVMDAEINGDIVKITLKSIPTGIKHKIIFDAPSKKYEENILKEKDATGYMFIEGNKLTPLVYIPSSGTLFWEKSCASGSIVAAQYIAEKEGNDTEICFIEPGGMLYVRAELNGKVCLWGSIRKLKEAMLEI